MLLISECVVDSIRVDCVRYVGVPSVSVSIVRTACGISVYIYDHRYCQGGIVFGGGAYTVCRTDRFHLFVHKIARYFADA